MLFGDVTIHPDTSSVPTTKAERANQRNAVLAGFLGWTLDAFDFFVLTFILTDVAQAFFPGTPLEQSRPTIVATITLTLAMRPVGAFIFGLMADRYGRRLPLMLNVIFYAIVSVLSRPRAELRRRSSSCGCCSASAWAASGASARRSRSSRASPRLRGLLSGLLQEGYAIGNLLAALAFRAVYVPVHAAHPELRLARDVLPRRRCRRCCRCSSAQGQGVGGLARAPHRLDHVPAVDSSALAALPLSRRC